MDLERLIRLDRRGLFSLVLMDVLAPRGSTSPLTPLWKARAPLAGGPPPGRPRARRRPPHPDGEGGRRHG